MIELTIDDVDVGVEDEGVAVERERAVGDLGQGGPCACEEQEDKSC